MIEFDKKCVELLNDIDNCHSKNAFLSALRHLDKAEVLSDLDPGMCVFRAITAEEEAATGIMLGIKERGYKLSNKFKQRDHFQKNAVYPFLQIVYTTFADVLHKNGFKIGLRIHDVDGVTLLRTYHTIPGLDLFSWPDPPLHFSFKMQEGGSLYEKQINDYLDKVGSSNVVKHLKELANLRNEVLYANGEGVPEVSIQSGYVNQRRMRVIAMLKVYLLIKPYADKQIFVQECVYSYLRMLNIISEEIDSAF